MLLLAHNWDSFLYQFLVGGVPFVAGIVIPIVAGDVKWSRPSDRRTLIWLFVGMAVYMALFLSWQLYAID